MYGDHHRMFLQAMMCRFICSSSEVKKLYKDCCAKYEVAENFEGNPQELVEFVFEINRCIRPCNMEIRKGVCEDTGTSYYALVNTVENIITRCASDYSVQELELFKKAVEKIVMADDGAISTITFLNLREELEKKMSLADAENLETQLVSEKWLRKIEGNISLSTRALLELEPYLRDVYSEEICSCPLCRNIILKGDQCPSCFVKIHFHCISKYFQQNRPVLKCPQCREPWTQPGREDTMQGFGNKKRKRSVQTDCD